MKCIGGTNHGQDQAAPEDAQATLRLVMLEADPEEGLRPAIPITWETYFPDVLASGEKVWRHESLDTREKLEATVALANAMMQLALVTDDAQFDDIIDAHLDPMRKPRH